VGKLTYDSTLTVDFEDRTLAHLQIVIGAKLRRGEAFYFSWKDDQSLGDGRSALWLHPAIPLYFKYLGSRFPTINRLWIEDLMAAANSGTGLHITVEPSEPPGEAEQGGVE
jgi:hypothetical protein